MCAIYICILTAGVFTAPDYLQEKEELEKLLQSIWCYVKGVRRNKIVICP